MLEIQEPFLSEYNRWLDEIGPDHYKSACIVGIHDILRAHFLLVDFFYSGGGSMVAVGPKNVDLLHSAVSRQLVSFDKKRKWTDDYHLCATLFYGLIKNHPFHDCNKRTALLVALHYLSSIGRTPNIQQKDLEILTVNTAEDKLDEYREFNRIKEPDDREVRFIAHFLRRNTREINKRGNIITYNELNAILKRYGFYLDNPSDSFIDVMKEEEQVSGFIFRKKQRVVRRLIRVPFPGWKSQVQAASIKRIREATSLDHRSGVDSDSFFKGTNSMAALISDYRVTLQRLAKK